MSLILDTISIPVQGTGAAGLTIDRHDDGTIQWTDHAGVSHKMDLTLANLNAFFTNVLTRHLPAQELSRPL